MLELYPIMAAVETEELLMRASLALSSRTQYQRAWVKLVGFLRSLNIIPALPVSLSMMMIFIAYLHDTGLAPASIISTVSAISYFHKINGFQDPAKMSSFPNF